MSTGSDQTFANPFARVRIVLVGTQHPGNLGAAARDADHGPVAAGAGGAGEATR